MIFSKEYLSKTVCNIRTPFKDGTKMEKIGTGIFMTKSTNDAYIITASHVASETDDGTYLYIGDVSLNCIEVPLKNLINSQNWIHHSQADLAVLKLTVTPATMKYLDDRCLPIDHFNLSRVCVSRDCELTSIGFPQGLGVGQEFNPLSFRSFPSSSFLTLSRYDTHTPATFFCLENPSIGGYSGCPIFDLGYVRSDVMFISKEKTICHGFTHGTMTDETGGKMATITPAFYLTEII